MVSKQMQYDNKYDRAKCPSDCPLVWCNWLAPLNVAFFQVLGQCSFDPAGKPMPSASVHLLVQQQLLMEREYAKGPGPKLLPRNVRLPWQNHPSRQRNLRLRRRRQPTDLRPGISKFAISRQKSLRQPTFVSASMIAWNYWWGQWRIFDPELGKIKARPQDVSCYDWILK